MKAISHITQLTLAAVFMPAMAMAQQLSFTGESLESGSDLQSGASYRFSNVMAGIDAFITIIDLNNVTIADFDNESANPVEQNAWRPTLVGTGSTGHHYADFFITFYANGTNTATAPEKITSTVLGNSLSNRAGAFLMEFTQVTGFSSVAVSDQRLNVISYSNGNSLNLTDAGSTALGTWNFNRQDSFTLRLGWQGDAGGADARTFGLVADNTSSLLAVSTVPEPSSVLLIVMSAFPCVLRRKR